MKSRLVRTPNRAARRALVALVLLLTIPLRALAGIAMPCCPIDAPSHALGATSHHASMSGSMAMDDRHDGSSRHDESSHRTMSVACCAMAAIGQSSIVAAVLPSTPPFHLDRPLDAIPAFLTDAPERPPRPAILSA